MGKDSQKHLTGQPIFKQIIQMIPRDEFAVLVKAMGEVCDGMRAPDGKFLEEAGVYDLK
ncbi:MAG: DUF4372 domain-containing protein [Tannerellaceae bacterium]|jgi:hypothetical protein|nr:DUF4372 domain-containing protein [Tannerellaceae bacterium]